ncbi:MAG: SDR family NAD(P)-dependent oxidoreductase [Candidatus Marinimicrobia bacterium]|nr:SDR family NAD(P)-dependent oxidoreductase [Candidatus Neomarinimicrobiota bacterium]
MDLSGKHILVTGASRGIGRTLAKTYVENGAQVTGCATSEDLLSELQDECTDLPGDFEFVVADLTINEDVVNLLETGIKRFGSIDVLVNNAGILGPRDEIADYPDETWDRVIDVNLNAVFHLTKAVLQNMQEHGSGRIINVTSGVGVNGYARWGAYSVSKFGIEGLTQVLADEVKDTQIETNAVNPGPISTEMRAEAYPEEDPATIPSPEDIMDIFLFLASEQSTGNNGKRYEAQEFTLE